MKERNSRSQTVRLWSSCLRAPVRALCSVRDLYVKGMNRCADRVQCSHGPTQFSRSYSFSTDDQDMRELVRVAMSTGQVGSQQPIRQSQSEAMGRIDEDEPCEFKEDIVRVGSELLFARSRSTSVAVGVRDGGKRRMRMFAL